MLLEVEDETRDFVTVYKKDFPAKRCERRKECRERVVYPPPLNILNGPFKKYLNTRPRNAILPVEEQTEDPQETLNRIRAKHPRLAGFFPEIIPDQDLIERKENEANYTVYHSVFSKGVYSPRVKIFGRDKHVRLPNDWVISETTQRKSYRNPWKIATKDLLYTKRFTKPPDNLVPSEKEREILRVRTGDTEYDAKIEATGNRVIEGQLLGPPLAHNPKIYTKGPDSPRSECSEVLKQKKVALPSNVM